MDRGEELLLPTLGLPGQAPRAVRRAQRLRAARLPLQRGAQLHRRRAAGLQHQPGGPAVGCADPVGSGSGRLRLGRRSRQLPERALLRARGRSRGVLAGRAPAREGHPAVPLRVLARDAPLGRVRGAEAALRPRLAPPGRPQDLEVARQRGRPARPRRRLRRRPGAFLVRARGLVRPGRQRLARRRARALRARARQRPRQPALADDRDDRAVPRRQPRPRPRRTPLPSRRSSTRSAPTSPHASTPST